MEKISIIVPVYKVEQFLEKCINSLLNQTYKNLEIILVDDGSPDNSGLICDKYAKKDKRIKVIHVENGGVSRARNIGIDNATGKYLTFVDSDDYIEINSYSKLLSHIDNKTELICYNYKYDNNGECSEAIVELKTGSISKSSLYNEIIKEKSICGYPWNKLYRLDIIKKFNIKFDEDIKIMEDLIFNLKYLEVISNIKYVDDAIYYYVQRENSALKKSVQFNNFKALKKIIYLLDKVDKSLSIKYKYRFITEYDKGKILKHNPNMITEELIETVNKYKKEKIFLRYKNKKEIIKHILIKIFPNIYKRKKQKYAK